MRIRGSNNKHTETIAESLEEFFSWVIKLLSAICAFCVFVVLPFYFQDGYTHIGSDKSYFYRTGIQWVGKLLLPVGILWCGFYLYSRIAKYKGQTLQVLKKRFHLLDVCMLLWGVSMGVSYCLSQYPQTALWGTKGWYMGFLPQIGFVTLYFLLAKFSFEKLVPYIYGAFLCVSAILFALGYLNRFDIWPLAMKNSGRPLFISTIGNINWYCCYAVTVAFVGIGLFWTMEQQQKWKRGLLGAYVLLAFMALITQGSESGIFAMLLVLFLMFVVSMKAMDYERLTGFWQVIILLGAAGTLTGLVRLLFPGRLNFTSLCGDLLTGLPALGILAVASVFYCVTLRVAADREKLESMIKWNRRVANCSMGILAGGIVLYLGMLIVNTLYPGSIGPLSESSWLQFGPKWGSSRGATWTLGISCFGVQDLVHRLFGVGPDCMADALYSGQNAALTQAAKELFRGKRLTNAHMELLTMLVNTGLLGLATYLSLFAVIFRGLYKCFKQLQQKHFCNSLQIACGLGMAAYFLNNLWSFQQTIGTVTLFAIMGLWGFAI